MTPFIRRAGVLGFLITLALGFSPAIVMSQVNQPNASNLPGATLQPIGQPSATPKPLSSSNTNSAASPSSNSSVVKDENYKLGPGDKIRLVVYGEEDLGGEYLVDGSGSVELPLLGTMPAAGKTIGTFQQVVGEKFVSEGYLKDPRVSVEVENYRPFYIIGEVKTPGQYPFVNGMNVLNAVALAGGYTYRANENRVYVRRNGDAKEVEMPADQTSTINPGDIIRVDERLF